MILKFNGGADVGIQAYYRRQFESHGVETKRVEIVGHLPFQEYLGLFHRLDLLLDTHPYNGCITTLEGLWMGVPILTLTGQTYVSRVGLSLLKRLGLEVFASSNAEEYVIKACSFASQIDALAQIRQSLRAMMLASPLCDPGRNPLQTSCAGVSHGGLPVRRGGPHGSGRGVLVFGQPGRDPPDGP
jgi:protein O-GlcNAc transferase